MYSGFMFFTVYTSGKTFGKVVKIPFVMAAHFPSLELSSIPSLSFLQFTPWEKADDCTAGSPALPHGTLALPG